MPVTVNAALGLALLAMAVPGQAAPCAPGSLTLDRGEIRRLVLCVPDLPPEFSLGVPPGIRVDYQQHLRRCGVEDKRPGVHLVLAAEEAARSGSLTITAAGRPVCGPVALTVPDRVVLPGATLRPRGPEGSGQYELRVPAGGRVDLGAACAASPGFPPGDGLGLAADPSVPPRCTRRELRAAVIALDARPGPAKVVLSGVRNAAGQAVEAVAHASPPPPAWTRAMAEADARYVTVDGVRTRYFEAGRGEVLLLVHGGQPSSMDGTAWDWQQNFPGLARHFHVYALDRIGQGYTDNPASLDEYQDYYPRVVRHVLAFMDAMDIRRAHLVGHSQGSWPVTRISLDHPERVASLTLVDGTMVAPPRDGGRALQFYLYLSQFLHPATGETLESVRRGMAMFSFSGNNLTEQRVERLLAMTRQPKYAESQAWFARSGMSPAHPQFRALKQQVMAELTAGRLRVPVLVVWGQEDPEGSLPSGLELFRLVSASSPRARLHVFGRAGHLSFIEYPAEFNRVLVDFALGGR